LFVYLFKETFNKTVTISAELEHARRKNTLTVAQKLSRHTHVTNHNTSTQKLFRDNKNYYKNTNTLSKNQTYTIKVHLLNASLER